MIFFFLLIVVLNIYCVADISSKYAWAKILTNEKAKTVLDGFIEVVN